MKPSLHLLPLNRTELVLRSFPKPDRSTGMPKILKAMAANGSPATQYETDDDRLACVIRSRSSKQRYRLNVKGQPWLASHEASQS
jgi:hypothetical protein